MNQGQGPETTELPKVTWEVVPPERFRQLLDRTINETVYQNVSAANSNAQLFEVLPPDNTQGKEKVVGEIKKTTGDAVTQLRAIQRLLKQDPNAPVPIDHRYESSGVLMIALDAIGNPPK